MKPYLSCDEAWVGAAAPAQEFDGHELLRGDVLCQLDEPVGAPAQRGPHQDYMPGFHQEARHLQTANG